MSRPEADLPERLLAGEATDFERRVLEAALENKPSPSATARMAKALGVTVTTVAVTATAAKVLAAEAAASKVTAAAGAAVWPWVSVGLVGLVVAGVVVGTRTRHAAPVGRDPAAAVSAPPAPPRLVADEPERQQAPAAVTSRRSRAATPPGVLADQTAFIDAARAAVSERSDRRALEILRRYQEKYPGGVFRPEATALRVEALVHLGRDGEARALAERFVAEHRGTLLAARVAEIAGLTKP
jgi:hypothetical protein